MNKYLVPFSLFSVLVFSQQHATGTVFEDLNKNGIIDRNEKGIANVSVSNGADVVLTDKNGRYTLPIQSDNIIFVIKPANYGTAIDENQLPKFYFNYKPAGSPANFKYKGVAPTGDLPKEINFPLYAKKEDPNFQILVFGDPQSYTKKEIDYFRRGIINEVKNNKQQAVFGISLGDLVGDDLNLHPDYIASVKQLGLPWYNVIGNHDMNYDAKEDSQSDETFESHFGPANYAFNYAHVHFIVLDDILYPDPRDGKGYWGGFRKEQLDFVENDLKNMDKNKLVVLAFHIQLTPENPEDDHFRMEDRQRLFDILQPYPNVLMMSAHTHKQTQLFYGKKEGWDGIKKLHEYNAGTTSGDWYSGRADAIGVPLSTMRDGTFRGYSFIDFKDNQYNIKYKVAGQPEDFQINIHIPKVLPYPVDTTAEIFANFFIGEKNSMVEYRIDDGNWKNMKYTETFDPAYTASVLEWDFTDKLFQGNRPSNPEVSKHIWSARFSKKLEKGQHTVEVRATDQFGNKHAAKRTFSVEDVKIIP